MAMPSPSWTAEELSRLPEDWRYEIDEGELVIMAPAGLKHGNTSVKVSSLLNAFVEQNRLGMVVSNDTGFRLQVAPEETLRAPDVAFISKERLARIADPKGFSEVPPDLAVEVKSASEFRVNMRRKVEQYLAAGVRSVWVLDPESRTLTQYLPDHNPAVYTGSATTIEDPVLPGLRCSLDELFGEES